MRAYLERIDPKAGMARFYAVMVTPTLFGEWAVVREWGRIGQGGTVRDCAVGTEAEAHLLATGLVKMKQRRGYVARSEEPGASRNVLPHRPVMIQLDECDG